MALKRATREFFVPKQRAILDDAWAAAQDADLLIYNEGYYAAGCMAEALDIPGIIASPIPFLTPTPSFPYPPFTTRDLGGFLNRQSYRLFQLGTLRNARPLQAWYRETFERPPPSRFRNHLYRSGNPVPVLYCASRHLIPVARGWHARVCLSGYWFSDDPPTWSPPEALEQFLSAGPPPVYIGFGSMSGGTDTEHRTRTLVSALERAGVRGVLATGWGGLAELPSLPPTVHAIEGAPHDWLFPRVSAVVHHGGAGTVMRGVRHGKPMLVCPIADDQPFWGGRIHALGLGPPPIAQYSRREFTVDRLAAAFHSLVNDTSLQRRARELAERVNAEDGVATAVAFVTDVGTSPS